MTVTIRELPDHERPRERLESLGASALSEAELIAILLRTGLRGANVIDVSRGLLAKYRSLSALARCSVAELQENAGLGLAKAVQLAAAFEIGIRLSRERHRRERMDSPELVHELLGAEMQALTKESLRVVLLDTKLESSESPGDLPWNDQ